MPAIREIAIYDESFESSEDLTGDQYKIVKLHTVAGQIAKAGAGEGIGVLQNKPNVGESAQVRLFGISRVFANAAAPNMEPGERLHSDANGFAVRSTTADDLSLGQTMSLADADGVIINVLLTGLLRDHS